MMPKAVKGAVRENYLLCGLCSDAAGEEVHYHRSVLEKREGFFLSPNSEGGLYCPKGHRIEEEA